MEMPYEICMRIGLDILRGGEICIKEDRDDGTKFVLLTVDPYFVTLCTCIKDRIVYSLILLAFII